MGVDYKACIGYGWCLNEEQTSQLVAYFDEIGNNSYEEDCFTFFDYYNDCSEAFFGEILEEVDYDLAFAKEINLSNIAICEDTERILKDLAEFLREAKIKLPPEQEYPQLYLFPVIW